MDMIIIGALLVSYLVGAIPIGYLITRYKGIKDIRKHGSGNIGATNVSRVLGTPYFFIIFLLDAGKAYLCLHTLSFYITYDYLMLCAGFLLLGNCYSIFLRGSGGKGVATLCGLLMFIDPSLAAVLVAVWAASLLITRTVGIASVIAAACLPLYVYMTTDSCSWIVSPGSNYLYLFSLFASSLVIYKHYPNIYAYTKKE
jgi:acyl phosphate:glycerol-3-phosphate acyltransferase